MDLQEFMEYVQEHILSYLPSEYEGADVDIQEIYKNNDVLLHGILIKTPDTNVFPTIYLEDFYEKYMDGESMIEIINEIADLRVENDIVKNAPNEIINKFMVMVNDYELAKEHLGFRLCDPELNTTNLQNRVFSKEGDYAATYKLWLITDDGVASINIQTHFLERWGVDLETLRMDAFNNMMKSGPVLNSMDDILGKHLGVFDEPPNLLGHALEESTQYSQIPMYVLTNEQKNDGASVICLKEVQEELGLMFGCNFYVLPSSIHETILIPDKKGDGAAAGEFVEMVRTVNATEVVPDEVLSDKVQYYDCNQGKLLNAVQYSIDYEKRRSKYPCNLCRHCYKEA